MTDRNFLQNLRTPNPQEPLRILMSACLTGLYCGYDGTNNGEYPSVQRILGLPQVKIVGFCPEEFAVGTPRPISDIYGGDGDAVLDGRAKVLTTDGEDWTEAMIRASEKMLQIAQDHRVELAIMLDISAACGSQVIYAGNRLAANKTYQIGAGVCVAQLRRHGFQVISQRDFAALEILYQKLFPNHIPNPDARDHHETDWYRSYFNR